MTNDSVQALGPLFGPDFVTIEVNDQTGATYALEVFPDANNPALKANKLPTQFYYMPEQVNLAKKVDNPEDYDLSVTLFKGLMTEEDTLGVSAMATVGGAVEAGGAFVAFSTTMAVPDSVVKGALEHLKAKSHATPPGRVALWFLRDNDDPDPLLGIVPIVDNNVTIEVPPLPGADIKSPWFINAQGTGRGSIEVSGISSFLVTCNQLAAGAIVGALKDGRSPFTVHYDLKEMFYMNECDITMNVDVDKVFTQFSADVQAKYGFYEANLQANYQSCVTSGAVSTIIHMNGIDVEPDVKQLIDKQVTTMQERAWNMVKSEIFDWQPKPEDPAKASTGACGGVGVALKFSYQKHAVHFNDHFVLNQTVGKMDRKSGTLTALEPAIKKNLDKYLSIVDIGEFFKKIQVCASPNIDFENDPIQEAFIQVSYPDFDNPKGPNGDPSFTTRVEGFHYNPTKIDQAAPVTLGRWTRENPTDIINFAFLKIDKDMPNWKRDQVKLKKKLVYKPDDARVDLSNNGISLEIIEEQSIDHAPVVGPESVGYIFIRFILDRPIKTPNVTVTLTVTIGNRQDIIQLTNSDPTKNPFADLQIWSDKYFHETVAKVNIDVEVAPPPSDFAGEAVTWSGVQAVPLNLGRIKRIVPYTIQVPVLKDAAKNALVGQYILQTLKEMSAVHV